MSGQFARLQQSLYRAHPTTLNQRIEVFANDLQQILEHYVAVSTELAELKAARTQSAQVPTLTDSEVDDLSRTMVKGGKSVNWLCRAIEAALIAKWSKK